MANWSALAGNTLSAVTAFPRHNPRTPSSRNTRRHTLPTLRDDRDPGNAASLVASCAMVLARSSGATAVLAATPATPPATRRAATRARRRSRSRPTGAAATSQFHVAFSPAMCAGGNNTANRRNSSSPTFPSSDSHSPRSATIARASSRVALAAPTARAAVRASPAVSRRAEASTVRSSPAARQTAVHAARMDASRRRIVRANVA